MSEKLGALELMGMGTAFQRELLDMLVKAPLFDGFSTQDIKFLAKYVQVYAADTGAVIFNEGDKGGYLCVMLEGKAEVFKSGSVASPGRKKIIAVGAGKTLGEMSIIDGMPYSATAIAATPIKVLVITKANFERIAEEQPRLGYDLLKKISLQLSQRLRRTTGLLVDYLE